MKKKVKQIIMKKMRHVLIAMIAIALGIYIICSALSTKHTNSEASVADQVESDGYEVSIQNFLEQTKRGDANGVAKLVRYPLNRQYPLKNINNEQEFVARYDELFDRAIIDSLIENPDRWQTMGWRGIMYNNGEIWFDYDGTLTAINWETELAAELLRKGIAREYEMVHPDVSSSVKLPVLAFKTQDDKWIGRIDGVAAERHAADVQLALYKSGTPLEGKPDYLLRGRLDIQGSAHNMYYFFQGDEASFVFENPWLHEENKHPTNLCIKFGECDIENVAGYDEELKADLVYWQDIMK